jgi:hypothetical protein
VVGVGFTPRELRDRSGPRRSVGMQCMPDDVDPALSLEWRAWYLPLDPRGKEQAVRELSEVSHDLFPNREVSTEVSGVRRRVYRASGQRDAVRPAFGRLMAMGGSRCPIAIWWKGISRRDGAIHRRRKTPPVVHERFARKTGPLPTGISPHGG